MLTRVEAAAVSLKQHLSGHAGVSIGISMAHVLVYVNVPQTKWLRQFWMQVQGATRLWTITSPLTLELDIERGIFQSVSRFTFKVYNLGVQARSDIYLDQNNWLATPRPIIVNAGYASWQSGMGPHTPQSFSTRPMWLSASTRRMLPRRPSSTRSLWRSIPQTLSTRAIMRPL